MVQRGYGAVSNASTHDMSVPRTMPSLTEFSASTRLSGSIDTDWADGIDMRHILHRDDNDNMVDSKMRSPFRFHCLFRILNCRKDFDDVEEWETHVTSHFKLQPLPQSVTCQICKEPFHSGESGEAWRLMLEHIATEHILQGQTLVGTRPDYELMLHLYHKGIASKEQLKLLQQADADSSGRDGGVGSPAEPYYFSVNSRRERRMMGRQF